VKSFWCSFLWKKKIACCDKELNVWLGFCFRDLYFRFLSDWSQRMRTVCVVKLAWTYCLVVFMQKQSVFGCCKVSIKKSTWLSWKSKSPPHSTRLLRLENRMLQERRSMCTFGSNRGMERRVWPQCRGWRRSSATRRFWKT